MAGIERTPSKTYTQRLGNDAIYGMGTDGNVTISTDTVLSSDKYYNNLTIDAGKVLYTNGFRVFVKDTLTGTDAIFCPSLEVGQDNNK